MKKTILSGVAFALALALSGCSAPGQETINKTHNIGEHITDTLQSNTFVNNVRDSVYQEVDQAVLLGKAFKIEETKSIPEYMRVPARFTLHQAKPISEVVEYLNNKYASYGLNIGFTSDAIEYLTSATKTNTSTSSTAGTEDSSGTTLNYSAVYNTNSASNLISGANVSISIPHTDYTTLKNVLDRVASTTNLWWEYDGGKVTFYRQKTNYYPVDIFATSTTLNSQIGSSTSGSGDSESTSSTTSSSSSFSLSRDLGSPEEQLIAGLKTMLSSDGKIELLPTLGVVTVSDTPDKLKLIESFIDHTNKVATRMIRVNIELWELVTTDSSNYGIEQAISYGSGGSELSFDGISLSDSTSLGGFAYKSTSGSFANTEIALKALQGTQSLNLKRRWETTIANNGTVPLQYVKEKAYAAKIGSTTSGDTVTQSLETATTTNGMVIYASPRINSDGTIQLSVVSNLSSLDSLDSLSVEDTQVMLPERTVSSLVSARNLRDGESVIINGFEQQSDNGQNNSIMNKMFWWLGGNDSHEKQRSMMLIMVTTHIERV